MGLPTVYDAPADALIERVKMWLKASVDQVKPPGWARFAKTGSHRERPPEDPDWWYVRAASILRKLYVKGPIGVSRLRKAYGGRKRYAMRGAHFRRAGGSVIREILQQLEHAGLVEQTGKGRQLTQGGKSLLDKQAAEILAAPGGV